MDIDTRAAKRAGLKALLSLVWRLADGETELQPAARALLRTLPRCDCAGCDVIVLTRRRFCSHLCAENSTKMRRDGAIHKAATSPLPHYRLEEREHE